MWFVATLSGLCLLCILTWIYGSRKWSYSVFRKMGVPTPKLHSWFSGHIDIYSKVAPYEQFRKWTQELGKTYGYYQGPQPILTTSDLDLIQQVFIKNFSKFHGHKPFNIQGDPDTGEVEIFVARGATWKRIRTILNPTFTSARMKQMYPLIAGHSEKLMEVLEKASEMEESTRIEDPLQAFTMDVIANCAFGLDVDARTTQLTHFSQRPKTSLLCGRKVLCGSFYLVSCPR